MYALVLPIRAFFMSAPHLHHSDKKLGRGANLCFPSLPINCRKRCHAERSRSISSLTTRYPPSFRGSIATVGISSLAMCAWSLVGFEEILRYTQNDNKWRHCEAWYKPWQSLAWRWGCTSLPALPAKNTKGDRGVAFSISSRGKLIKNYFCAKNALISSSSKMFCVWKT